MNPPEMQLEKSEPVKENIVSENQTIPQEDRPTESISEASSKEINWQAFRETRKKERAEKEAAERRAFEKEQEVAALKAAMEAAFSKQQSSNPYYAQNGYEEESEEKSLERKIESILFAKQQAYQKEMEEKEIREYPQRLKRDLPDFHEVCSQDNLDYLDYHYPEISRPLQRLQEGYDKWNDIYHAVKKLLPNHSSVKKDAMRADINSMKPKSISGSGANQEMQKQRESLQSIEERRAQNWQRMQRVMKGIS